MRLTLASVLNQFDNLCHGALAIVVRGAKGEHAAKVDAPRRHLVVLAHVARLTLAGKRHGVERRATLDDYAVDRHFLTRLDYKRVASRHLLRRHVDLGAVAQHMGHVGSNVHKVSDAGAALALGIALKEFANLEKQHHKHRLGKLVLGTGQKTDAQCAHCGYGHQEVLVEHLAVQQSLDGLDDGAVAHQKIWHQIHQQQLPRGQLAVALDAISGGQQQRGNDDDCQLAA